MKNNRQTEIAIENFERYLELEENIGISYKLAELYLKKGNLQKALIHFNNVGRSNQQFFLQSLGEKYFQLKMYKEALKAFLKTKKIGNSST